jgi:thiosulfate/3-mercaptopyruvate sulfurtransferase
MTSVPAIAQVLTSPIVSTQWLADHLGGGHLGGGLVVLDASVLSITLPSGAWAYLSGHEQYLVEGHLPGAVFADLIDELSDPEGSYAFTRPDAERFETAVGELGIDNETTVVIYDSGVGQWAARLWWLFRAFGYDRVAVLDGGLTKWRAEGRALETGHVPAEPALFEARERPELWVDKEFIAGVLQGDHDAALICAAPAKEFTGEVVARVRAGHIPGSTSTPAVRLVDRENRAYLPHVELRNIFAPALGRPRIVTYCGGGIAAASAALALTLLGETSVAIYDGSLHEWAADPSLPLVTTYSGG